LWGIGLALQFLVLAALVRGPWREFPIVLTYIACLLVTTVGEIAAFYTVGRQSRTYIQYYWSAELLRQTALFALVISLVIGVLPEKNRGLLLKIVLALAVVFWVSSVGGPYHADLNTWMNRVVRNLSFGTAVINLGLWFALISMKTRDTRRLVVSGALGLQMTGEALGQSIRHLFPAYVTALTASLFVVAAHFICLVIWWRVFWAAPKTAAK
jgi:hypothetical protein